MTQPPIKKKKKKKHLGKIIVLCCVLLLIGALAFDLGGIGSGLGIPTFRTQDGDTTNGDNDATQTQDDDDGEEQDDPITYAPGTEDTEPVPVRIITLNYDTILHGDREIDMDELSNLFERDRASGEGWEMHDVDGIYNIITGIQNEYRRIMGGREILVTRP
jgi:hypothetical protein